MIGPRESRIGTLVEDLGHGRASGTNEGAGAIGLHDIDDCTLSRCSIPSSKIQVSE